MERTVLILIAAVVTLSTSSTITPTIDMVTVRLGEAIHLSCDITLTVTESLSVVRWYRGSSFILYGSIDVQHTGCPEAVPCPEETTTDNRGTVRYGIRTSNVPVLTLTIYRSTLEDNVSFRCGIIKDGSSYQTSSGISVTVYVPEATTPDPIPGLQTTLGTTTTESLTNSPDTTTVDRSISSHQTSTTPTTSGPTTKKAISPIVTENRTDTTDVVTPSHQQDISTKPRKSSSTTDEQGSFSSSISNLICRETHQAPVSLTVPILAVAVSACMVTIIILLIILAYLVSSRKRRSEDAQPRLGLRSPEDVASSITPQGNGPLYQNTNQPHTYENTTSDIPHHQDGDKSTTSEQPATATALPTYYEPVQAGGGSNTQHSGAQRHPGRRVHDTSTVTTGDVESGYQALEMTNQPPAEYTKLDLSIRDV